MPDDAIENELRKKGYQNICGVDEAGRGPLAGPVCAAAVILPEHCDIPGLNDSKKLSEKKREALYDVIIKKAVAYGIALVDNHEIDRINILNATYRAMESAVGKLGVAADFAIIDGNRLPDRLQIPMQAVVKGDAKSVSIAAASILAKVTRDRLMLQMDEIYPVYGFAKHKGYGTKLHCEMLLKHGACEIHRQTFIQKILQQ